MPHAPDTHPEAISRPAPARVEPQPSTADDGSALVGGNCSDCICSPKRREEGSAGRSLRTAVRANHALAHLGLGTGGALSALFHIEPHVLDAALAWPDPIA